MMERNKGCMNTVAVPLHDRSGHEGLIVGWLSTNVPKSPLQQRAYDLISYRGPDNGLPAGTCGRQLGQVCRFEAEVGNDHGGLEVLRHVMLWKRMRTALIFCVTAGNGEGGDVVRAWASVLFGHASERSLCGRWCLARGSRA